MNVPTREEQFQPHFDKAVKGRLEGLEDVPLYQLEGIVSHSAQAVLKAQMQSTLSGGDLRSTWMAWVDTKIKNIPRALLAKIWNQAIDAVAGTTVEIKITRAEGIDKTAIDLLSAARDIQVQRAKDYDQPGGERSMLATVQAFNIITRRDGELALTESEGWLLMQILKDVRDRSTKKPHRDSLEDGIAYSSLKAEARLKES